MRSALSHTQGTQAGIHVFLPIASLHAMLGVDMGEITNRVLPLDVVFGPKGLELGLRMVEANDIESRFQVLDAAIGQRLGDMKAADRVVDWAVTQLHANPNINITSLAADIGWSRKHLVDRFRRHIGAGPRAFGRLLRFERAWSDAAAAATPNWAYLAASHGYADQSHLIHDFRAFSGFTPTELAARLLPHGGGIIES
jgi:AraC-like DNA-binding protein